MKPQVAGMKSRGVVTSSYKEFAFKLADESDEKTTFMFKNRKLYFSEQL